MVSIPSSLRLKPGLEHRLEEAAESEDVSASDMASEAIEAFLDAREFKRQEIAKAFAEADNGVFISQEAMHRWMDSWGTDNELPPPEPDIFPQSNRK